MFEPLTEVFKTHGHGIHGFQKCASIAFECGMKDPAFSAPFFLLGSAAEFFVNYYDRQPLPTEVAEAEALRFESYVTQLEEAFSSGNNAQQVIALNSVAAKIIEYRVS